MSNQVFKLQAALKLVQQLFQLEQSQGKARAKKIDSVFGAGFRHIDCTAKTTRLDKDQFKALKLLALGAITDDVTRMMATMPSDAYRARRDQLEGRGREDFIDLRAKAVTMAGPYLDSLRQQLLRRETPKVQAAVAKAAEVAKAERAAKKATKSAETDAKTGREKILAQMANIQKIMQSDGDPEYPVSKVQAALELVMRHLG